ncbi:hypothetical protein [Croceicoccus naphthovorans]|uniref:hypothetical protein n=1 Tax=Croceicoccus naphthovorans TaxID=1348774 RepID=UPI000A938C33|nr:hypothetical protein [Croceicoccus naphthovorans]MBB3992262.1 hypothetical protein [Croceicoccus naphthovorans]
MSNYTTRSSGPDRWSRPVQKLDPSQRLARYGRLQPLEAPSLLDRIFRRRSA